MVRLFFPLFKHVLYRMAVVLGVAALRVPARAQFETRATALFPQGAWSVGIGDFNRDGKLDLVVLADNGFVLALGNGDGTFRKPVFHPIQHLSYSLAVGDFNGDGNLDLVLANLDPNTVSVYLGNGDGTFKAPIISNTTAGSYFVTVGDFNGDKKLDIAIIDPPYISVLLGKNNGKFQPPSDNNSFFGTQWLAVADFNNDLKADVLVTGYSGASYNIGLLLGNGDGTLQDSITTPIEYVPAAVAAGDLRGDGKMDAILGYALDGVAVFLGNGDGTLQPAVNYNTTGLGNGEVIVGDLNLDGRLDVVVPSGVGVDVLWGNGDGTLQQTQFFASGETGSPVLGDLNGDGLPDLALSNEFYTTTMLNTGSVGFSPTTAPLVFPTQLVNTVSPPQTVKLTNNGRAPLSISSVKVSGPFQMSNKCGKSLAAGAVCSVSAEYKPKAVGAQTGAITIVDSASSKPQFVDLTGSATIIKVSPASLNFGSQKIGTKSAQKSVTATNEGSTPITFTSIVVYGNDYMDFSETDTCAGNAINSGSSCTVTVVFKPTEGGARSSDIYLNLPTGTGSPAPVPVSGTGD